MKPINSFLTGLLAGAVVGGVIALLYAPQSGKETREQIKQKIDDLENELNDLKANVKNRGDHAKDDLLSKLAQLQSEIDRLKEI